MPTPSYEYRKAFLTETLTNLYNAGTKAAIESMFTSICAWIRTINVNGELPVGTEGDVLTSRSNVWVSEAPAVPYTNVIQNLGSAVSGHFDITGLSDLDADANVQIFQSAQPVPSKGDARDEFEMDAVVATGYVVDDTTIRVYWFSSNGGIIVGDVAFAYHVGR